MDHWYGLVAGHVEEGETFTQGAIREAFEEA
jgi:8-oxo-dGTP pyrophosphatase MutT (NUDIX family)